jgi:CelD/BcsL family acetyltransferase involved in cellulose biosynthesis
LISTFKRKSRQQLRQTHSAYLEVGDLTIKAAEDREEALGLFHKMERLHTMRWKKFGKNGSYANPRWVEFHTNIIESCFQSGNVQLLEIKCGGEALGYLYGHVYDNNVYMHQTGFVQTESAKFRPGYLSHCLAMWLNVREGNMVYDFLPDAADSYKKFFASEGPDVYFVRAARPRLKFVYEASLRKVAGSLKTLTSSYRGTGGKDS